MILTILEYAKRFPSKGKVLSAKTIIRKCDNGLLPSNHHALNLPCESGGKGQWIIEIENEVPQIKVIKTDPSKPDLRTLNRKYFNIR